MANSFPKLPYRAFIKKIVPLCRPAVLYGLFYKAIHLGKFTMKRFVLRIELNDIKPLIWRRIVVPAQISLDRLHDIFQIAMGWEDCHLHEFHIGTQKYMEAPESNEDGLEESRFFLDALAPKNRFTYAYDFGDDWRHTVILEQILKPDEFVIEDDKTRNDWPLACIGGERACPPEDVGGVEGYHHFCTTVSDQDYAPDFFDKEQVNMMFLKYMRWTRNRNVSSPDWG